MKAIIWKVTERRPSKMYDNVDNQVVVFKSIDENDKGQYKLNLDYRFPDVVSRWLPNIQEGNVLDVNIRPGTKNVDAYSQYKLIERKQQLIKSIPAQEVSSKCDHCIHYHKIKEQMRLFD